MSNPLEVLPPSSWDRWVRQRGEPGVAPSRVHAGGAVLRQHHQGVLAGPTRGAPPQTQAAEGRHRNAVDVRQD